MDPKKYEHGAVVSAEGARIAFVVCKRCGAAILLHPTIDTMKLHDEWHDEIRAMIACPQDFDLWPAPTEQGEARVDSDTLHAIAQNAYNRALAPRDTTCNPNDAMHEAVDAVLDALHDPAPPRGERDDLAARLEARADNADKMAAEVARNPSNYGESGPRHHARLLAAAYAFRKAAEMARASTHPEQWVSGDDREWLLWITSYVLNRHEFTDSAATDARAALTRIATAIKQPASPTPTEQGEDRTRVEWHDGIEDGDELALRQLAADIGCGIPYGCQPSIGKWYAAALDRVLDRLLPLDPAPEQGEGEAS